MTYNFDEVIERIGTGSSKWDKMESLYGLDPHEGIPMWVADMDFKPPQSVIDCVKDMAEHGVFGYGGDQKAYTDAICSWMERHHGWTVDPAWISSCHGMMNGISLAIQQFTNAGDGVIIFTPVYHGFISAVNANKRRLVESELINNDGHHEMDFDALEARLQGDEKMVILCSPHNPGGRVWTREELRELGAFCVKHDLILVSDEVHHDLVFSGNKHIPMAMAMPEISDRLIMLSGATKTFNLAGMHTGNVIIEDPELRKTFEAGLKAGSLSPSAIGVAMATAAYNGGDEWLAELLEYLAGNRKIFDAGMNAIPGVKSMPLEATYLAWVDFRALGMSPEEIKDRIQKTAKIAVNYGSVFGKGGEAYMRFNLATRRALVEEAVDRLSAAFSDLQ